MVRLEKVLWEQLVNVKQLKRGRTLAQPQKWYNENRNDAYKVVAHKVFNQGITSSVLGLLEPILAKFVYRWAQNICHTRGLALEDVLLFQDRQLRRCFIWESYARGSMHPYTWVFAKRRRARFYKVERGLRGFEVPTWVRNEASQRTLAETLESKEQWENFMYNEYQSEQTPTGRWSCLSKWNVLDMFSYYGLWRPEAYDRLFYNEVHYEGFTQGELAEATNSPFGNLNLGTSEGRKLFEQKVNRFIELYPGSVTKPGETFDFNRFYAEWALANGKDTSSYDQELLSSFRNTLNEQVQDGTGSGNTGKNIGTVQPEFVRPQPGQTFFQQ